MKLVGKPEFRAFTVEQAARELLDAQQQTVWALGALLPGRHSLMAQSHVDLAMDALGRAKALMEEMP